MVLNRKRNKRSAEGANNNNNENEEETHNAERVRFDVDQDSDDEVDYAVKPQALYLNKPQNTNCAQQYLAAWKPLLTPKFVFFLFMACAFVFIPIGFVLYITSNKIYEFQYDYTDCIDVTTVNTSAEKTCHDQIANNFSYDCKCRVQFHENRFQKEPLMVYYMLSQYYQNHRRYVKSRDHDQLLGRTDHMLTLDCEPYRYYQDENKVNYKYAPCGVVANSMFNDTFQIFYVHTNNDKIKINISKSNLAWYSDKKYKFQNPKDFKSTVKPPNWKYNISYLENGYNNNDLIVWMRTAAFSEFRKLYGRILFADNLELWQKTTNHTIDLIQNNSTYSNSTAYLLPKGHYFVDIHYRYMVKQFSGRKHFILANTSWFGGKCYFLAVSYIVIGVLCLITAISLLYLHYFRGKMSYEASLELLEGHTDYSFQ